MNMITINKKLKKTSQGRKKIEIKKIEDPNSRQVTFSKRRTGIFKKAGELCVLTGCEIAVLVNSPGGRVIYAFGHPTPDVIIDRYLNCNNGEGPMSTKVSPPLMEMKRCNEYYVEKSTELQAEKRRKEMIQESKTVVGDGGVLPWYHESYCVDGMEVDELVQYLAALVELKRKVSLRAVELEMIRNGPKSLGPRLMLASNMSEVEFTNGIQNTMVSSNDFDSVDFGFGDYNHNLDSMMQVLG